MNTKPPIRPFIRDFGHTGLRVSAIGFGAMHFDGIDDENQVGALLNGVLDEGITLIDTARGYGRSEERIGRHIAHRRSEYVLSTKFGYGVEGVPDWTYDCVAQGVDRALRVMRTDHIDIGHLHSCPLDVLQRGEVTQALADAVQAGKLRVAAYSGENAELAHALADARFGSVQTSISLTDQANIQTLTQNPGKGVLVKRALAGLAWTRQTRPDWDGSFCESQYFDRLQALTSAGLHDFGMDWDELALRLSAHQAGVNSVLLGTKTPANLKRAIQLVQRGPLPPEALEQIQTCWRKAGGEAWPGII